MVKSGVEVFGLVPLICSIECMLVTMKILRLSPLPNNHAPAGFIISRRSDWLEQSREMNYDPNAH